MTAPTLVALAHGSRDPRSAATVADVCRGVAALRPDLRVEVAFLDHCDPRPMTVFDRLARDGVEEAVVVPLLLTNAFHARVDVPAVVDAANDRHPGLRVRAASVLGFEHGLLDALDRRLRTALSAARVRELDGLVLACAGSSDRLANQAVARVARLWGARHKLPAVASYACAVAPSAAEALRTFRDAGRRHVAVGSYFLAPGSLPDRTEELALDAGAVAIAQPLGDDPEIVRAIVSRYLVGAVEMVPIPA